MKRLFLIIAALLLATPAYAQQVTRICFTTNGINCIPVDSSNPFPVTATITGTQNVNLTQILGAAPSLTNPLFVTPATGASFTVANPIGITPTDRTITSASGASQQLMAANAARHSLQVVNTGNANCGVNPTGGTAAIGGAGTLTLGPLGSYYSAIPTLSAVTVICTSGQPVYANEN